MNKVFKELINFYKKPSFHRREISFKEFLFLFGLKLVLVLSFFLINDILSLSYENETYGYSLFSENIILFLVIGTIFFPLYEEFLFRLCLSKKIINVLLPLFYCIIFIFFIDRRDVLKIIVYTLYLCFLIYLLINQKTLFQKNSLPIIFSAGLFAVTHIFGYDLDKLSQKNNSSLILSILPQFIGGLILNFIRLRFGFKSSFLFHFFWNLILMLIVILTINISKIY